MAATKQQIKGEAMAATSAIEFKKSYRYRIGMTLIIVGHLILVLAIVLPFLGLGASGAGFLFASGEAMAWLSIVFLGKEGFKEIKGKIFRTAKAGFVAPVGRLRHYIGIFLVFFNGLTAWTLLLLVLLISSRATPELPTPEVWGLDWSQQNDLAIFLLVAGEVTFFIGIYVLGADWWDRFRQLFIWKPVKSQAVDYMNPP
ncbi:MAG: hypothetical protein PVG64_03700 [Syntrophobacterales bacterium]|jgi:hypothetical protein